MVVYPSHNHPLTLSFNISSHHRVLAQADAPHTIVHANRAFSEFSGLDTGDVVGKDLDSIVAKRNGDDTSSVVSQDDFIDAKVTAATSSDSDAAIHRKCQMKTILVRDAPSHKHPVTFASPVKAKESLVTHVLVQVKPLVQIAKPEVAPRAVRRSTGKVSSNQVLETVG